ncbi:MAG: chemotaxis-related protein WspD [Candidatus Hydrogenedentes bacterium]|nr:chemotaxis-related protein WspD [Candidatus Hydrogenedentota bacterium]
MMRQPVENCWKHIGVWGDRSCPALVTHVHCRNCPVYESSARGLLDRPPPEGYQQEWAALLAVEKESETKTDRIAGVFRIGSEWLALPAHLFSEVVTVRPIRPIPHRASGVLLGLVSVRGAINLCVCLKRLLELGECESPDAGDRRAAPRFVVATRDHGYWVFPVDEVAGLHRYREVDVQPPPANVAKAAPRFSRGVLAMDGRMVGLLDENRVFTALERALL